MPNCNMLGPPRMRVIRAKLRFPAAMRTNSRCGASRQPYNKGRETLQVELIVYFSSSR